MGDVTKLLGSAQQASPVVSSGASIPQTQPLPPLPDMSGMLNTTAPGFGGGTPVASLGSDGFGVALAAPSVAVPGSSVQPASSQPDLPGVNDTMNQIVDSLGKSDSSVKNDNWQPPHHESLLAQIGDWFTRGLFRQRTDAANIQDAMQGFQDHPALSIARVAKVDPKAAWQMYTQNTTVEGNKGLQEDRIAGLQDKGREVLGSFAGSILKSPDPVASAKRLLPTMQTMAKTYHLPDDYIGDLTDKNNLASLRDGAITPAQQESLGISKSNSDRMASIEQQNVDLSKGRLALSAIDTQTGQYNAQTARMNAETAAGKTTQGAKPVFNNDLGGKPAGLLSQDGYNLILMGPDGQPHAWKLRKKGDLNSRVPNPSDDPLVQAARNKALGLNPDGTPKQ